MFVSFLLYIPSGTDGIQNILLTSGITNIKSFWDFIRRIGFPSLFYDTVSEIT
jgi:hypothetical protein